LQSLVQNFFSVAILYLYNHLEWELLQSRDFIAEVARVLINWDPDAHGVGLNKAVERVDVEPFVDVSLKSHQVLNASLLVPVLELVI
jgi:hypothetical protein